MEDPQILDFARAALAPHGVLPHAAGRLAHGATAEVWRLDTDRGAFVLRLVLAERSGLDGRLAAALRRAAQARGARVVVPIASAETEACALAGRPWTIEPLVEGGHPPRAGLGPAIGRDLGETLAALHGLATRGHGRPVALGADGRFIGRAETALAGVAMRFERPLPTLWRGGVHPLLDAAPELAKPLLARLEEVEARVAEGRAVLCHGDLHERQLICRDGRLAALIDFGDVTLLDRHWDLGSARYFHGAADFAAIEAGYAGRLGPDPCRIRTAENFSLAVAMHHGARAALRGKEHRAAVALAHIRQVLSA